MTSSDCTNNHGVIYHLIENVRHPVPGIYTFKSVNDRFCAIAATIVSIKYITILENTDNIWIYSWNRYSRSFYWEILQ